MKKDIFSSIKATFLFCGFFIALYILPLSVFALVAGPGKGEPEWVIVEGRKVGAANVGQTFTSPCYFWSRPSATGHSGDGSGGSNKAVGNKEYLSEVEKRVEEFLAAHPYLTRAQVTAEMVTASGSGIDPHITPESARIQVRRVAEARGVSEEVISEILRTNIEKPFLNLFGTAGVNVLKLNISLDEVLGKTH